MTSHLSLMHQAQGHFISIGNFLLTLIFVSFILRSKKPPGSTMAWLFFIIIIPYVGIPFYLIFSTRKFSTKLQRKEALFEPHASKDSANLDTVERILENLGAPKAQNNSDAVLLTSGQSAFFELTHLIESARESINLTTFIFADDEVGQAILKLLAKKAGEGIKVRVLLDSLGSLWVRHPSFKEFRAKGGRVGYFMPLLHIPFRGRTNLRNHRKIIVVDRQVAILGGMNIATEYMGPKADPRQWVDLGLKIKGPSVADIEDIFVKDWTFATGEKGLDLPKEKSGVPKNSPEAVNKIQEGDHRLQIVASGPDVKGDPLYDVLLTLIFEAQRKIWIATPYFIPDESLAKALQLAAQRGVEVKILVPEKSNHSMADLARGSYLKQVSAAGCQVAFLTKMIHAKAFLVDDEYVLLGSANFDMRSLLLNYEIGALITSATEGSSTSLNAVRDWFIKCFSDSHSQKLPGGFWIDLVEGIGRVLGPLI